MPTKQWVLFAELEDHCARGNWTTVEMEIAGRGAGFIIAAHGNWTGSFAQEGNSLNAPLPALVHLGTDEWLLQTIVSSRPSKADKKIDWASRVSLLRRDSLPKEAPFLVTSSIHQ